jgi:hypothetical protein
MFQRKWALWTLVSVGVLLGAGPARAESEKGTADSTEAAMPDECQDAGISLTFGGGSSKINAKGRNALNDVVKWLEVNEGRSARIEVYPDKAGKTRLADKRAQSAKDYLVSRGIAAERIQTISHGAPAKGVKTKVRPIALTTCEAVKQAEAAPPAEQAEAQAPVVEALPTAPVKAISAPVPQVVEPAVPSTAGQVTAVAANPAKKDVPGSVVGIAATLGGGMTGFVGAGARTFANSGPSYEARATFGTRLPLAVETAYVGSIQGFQSTLGLADKAFLMGNGAETDLRINITRMRIQPYVFGGAGWTNYRIQNTDLSNPNLNKSDNVLTIPFGLGATWRIGRALLVDVRGTARVVYGDTLFDKVAAATNAGNAGLNNWNVGARVGWVL